MLISWLFVPGSRDKHLNKAEQAAADALIFDLEDAVAPKEKELARKKVSELIPTIKTKSNFVRVNGLSSEWFMDDLNQVVESGLSGIILPKINGSQDIIIADYILSHLEKKQHLNPNSIAIIPLIETAKSLYHVHDIAVSSRRISRLAFGAEDFRLDLNIAQDSDQGTLYARSKLVMASRAAMIDPPIDGIYPYFQDDKGLKHAATYAKELGFQGKLLIHPKQIETVHRVFSPTAEEVSEAAQIIDTYEASIHNGDSVIQVNGKMIDEPIVEHARKILSYAGNKD